MRLDWPGVHNARDVVADYARTANGWGGAGRVIEDLLAELDVEATLRSGGLTGEDIAALRERLVEPG